MGRLALAAIVVTGCNQLYGLDQTRLLDARPERCPDIGTLLTFDSAPTTIITDRNVSYYQTDRAHSFAIALRSGSVVGGPIDTELVEPAIAEMDLNRELRVARLAPEGDQILIAVRDKTTDVTSIERFELADGAWRRTGTLAITFADEFDTISAPTTRDAPRRMLHLTRAPVGFSKVIQELAEDGAGNWTSIGEPYTPFMLGVDGIFDPNLTPDGLRVVFSGFGFSGENAVYYAERASVDARFGQAARLLALIGNGLALSPFLLDDCTRMYFYAVPGIHHVRR